LDEEAVITRWSQELDAVGLELLDLAHIDDVFWQLQAVFAANDGIPEREVIFDWVGRTYVATLAAGLRRLVDHRKRMISLHRLLSDMATHCTLLTRHRYVELHDGGLRDVASEWFVDMAGGEHDHIPRARIQSLIAKLDDSFERVSRFASENVAHRAPRVSVSVTFDEARNALVQAFLVYSWCSRVLKSQVPSNAVPEIQTDWLAALMVPWIQADGTALEYTHLDTLVSRAETESPV